MSNRTSVTALCAVLVLTACGGSSSSGGGGAATFGDLALEGTVLYANGDPAPNVAVRIAGRGPFVTGGDGTFVVNDAPVPYDAIVFDGAGGAAQVWQGLTRPDPVFTIEFPLLDTPFSTAVDGNVSGGVGLPVPMTHETEVYFGFEEGLAVSGATPNATTGDYGPTQVQWSGPVSGTLHVHALQYLADVDGNPVSYSGYGSTSAPVVTSDTLMNQDIVMAPVGTAPISGTVTAATTLLGYAAVLFLDLPGNTAGLLPGQYTAGASFTVQAPTIPGAKSGLLIYGIDSTNSNVTRFYDDLSLPTTNLDVDLPVPTKLVLPVDGATNVGYATDFLVSPSPGDRVFRVSFRPTAGPGPRISVYTTASTIRIPDLGAYGMALPANTEYTWGARALGPATAVDDLAVEIDVPPYLQVFGASVGFTSSTETRSVFTAP